MLSVTTKNNQPNLFHLGLRDMFDSNDPLIALADTINWEEFDNFFTKYYSNKCQPPSKNVPLSNICYTYNNSYKIPAFLFCLSL